MHGGQGSAPAAGPDGGGRERGCDALGRLLEARMTTRTRFAWALTCLPGRKYIKIGTYHPHL